MKAALVLFAHGSRDPQWAGPFHAIKRRVADRRQALTVELAFLEIMEPKLPEAVDALVASGHTHITVAPLFMGQGAHLRRDLTGILDTLRAKHGAVEFKLLPAAGEAEPVLDAMSAWLAETA